jgi:hypothetical protein
MNTAADLLLILVFLAAFYTVLGLLCGIAEKARELLARPHQRRRMRRSPQRRMPPRRGAAMSGGIWKQRPPRAIVREETA